MDQLLWGFVGLVFIAGGGFIAYCSLEAKNLIQTAIFGLIGVGVGLFLLVCAVLGPPQY